MQDKRDTQDADTADTTDGPDIPGTGGEAAPGDMPGAQIAPDSTAPDAETGPGSEAAATEAPDTPDDPKPVPETGPETKAGPGPQPEPETAPDDTARQAGEIGEAAAQTEPGGAAPEVRETPDAPDDPGPPPETGPEAAPEPGPAPGQPCAAGLFGKMPARGDFISRTVAQDVLRPLEDWLLPLVQAARELLGDDWGRAWRHAPAWRFWIGPDILRGDWTRSLRSHDRAGAMTGVLLPSADRQGRLFPLVLVLADDHARLMPPPVLAPPDRGWFAACDRLLHAARDGAALETVEADLAALRAPRLPDDAAQMAQLLEQRALWGQGAGQAAPHDADDVWSGIRASDHHLAATGRSYWWCEAAGGATSVISLGGLPDAETFAFMLTDAVPADMPQTGA